MQSYREKFRATQSFGSRNFDGQEVLLDKRRETIVNSVAVVRADISPWDLYMIDEREALPGHLGNMAVKDHIVSRQVFVYDDIMRLPDDVEEFVANLSGDDLCLSSLWFKLLQQFSPAPGQPVSYTHLTLPTNREV